MTQTKRDWEPNSTKKGKRGGHFNTISKSVMLWICFYPKFLEGREWVTKWLKATFEGDKCQVEGMQYILLALVYFGNYGIIIEVACSREKKGVGLYGKSDYYPTLYA
jgi:hypothetical protein